jgi:hypothetical protein
MYGSVTEMESRLPPLKQDHAECHNRDDEEEYDEPEVVNAEISHNAAWRTLNVG